MDDPAFAVETDLATQSLLLAAANHDIRALRDLLRNTSANIQDTETGFTPLHAAIAACEPDAPSEDTKQVNGHTNGVASNGVAVEEPNEQRKQELEAAVKTIKLLFENGAIWNDLDVNGETPGCIAHRLGLQELYELCVDAGVRAELLLSRLDEYQPLGDDDSDEEEEEEEENDADVTEAADDVNNANLAEGDETTQQPNYLASNLTFDRNRILDDADNGVMMQWESKLMKRSAELLTPSSGLRMLNVGHGMGIIDGVFQQKAPKSHHIIEAHPDVLKRMKEQGWNENPGVVVHEGRWQDIVPDLVDKGELFDAIYFDTFAEDYKALREFFTEYVIGLLDPAGGPDGQGGKFGFFNGMGADRQVCYDVYNKIVELDLFEAGFDTEFETISVPDLDAEGEWEGVRRKYWVLENYKLPTCSFIG
ncbi:arginine N-methyltransferas-like protein [Lophiotrema nucula]|uniref:Arginine N-methyltransferase 2 n=1 Tax=Lophiotrema nucula TaxID=690887 RepID=A0A6A5YQ67_9PLEO|nr:arginine N-methyltransferas-like protein [Lophiotrema nucula]